MGLHQSDKLQLSVIDSEECVIHGQNGTSSSALRTLYSTLHTIIPTPDNFLPQFRNPCWNMSSNLSLSTAKLLYKANISDPLVVSLITNSLFQPTRNTLVCMPSVYFIGFPRSGSTQLYTMLLKHPHLQGGYIKEPHWWTKTKFKKKFPYNILSVVQYLLHYLGGSQYLLKHPDTLLIDGSQSTVWDSRTIRNLCALPHLVFSVVPEAKYIVLMRHPVKRLFSDMMYLCEEHKNKTIPSANLTNATEVFLESARLEIIEFQKCLLRDNLPKCTHHVLNGYHGVLQDKCGRVRLGISLYHVHIRKWLQVIPREQFLFLWTDDMAHDPLKVLERVWSFLGVPEQNKDQLNDILHEHIHGIQHQAIDIHNEKFTFINKFFQPHNQQLAELLQDHSFSW